MLASFGESAVLNILQLHSWSGRHSLDQTPVYVTGGTLPPDATYYVERQADLDLLRLLAGNTQMIDPRLTCSSPGTTQ